MIVSAESPTVAYMVAPNAVVPPFADPSVVIMTWVFVSRKDSKLMNVVMTSWGATPSRCAVEQNRAHQCLVDPALYTHRYFTSRPTTGLQARQRGTGKINPASDLFSVWSLPYPRRRNVETRYWNMPTSSSGPPSSRMAWRCSRGMSADIICF